jgi:hypothetical protein
MVSKYSDFKEIIYAKKEANNEKLVNFHPASDVILVK